MVVTETDEVQSSSSSYVDDICHYYCDCSEDIAMCGESLKGHAYMPDAEDICPMCEALLEAETPCPRCGEV